MIQGRGQRIRKKTTLALPPRVIGRCYPSAAERCAARTEAYRTSLGNLPVSLRCMANIISSVERVPNNSMKANLFRADASYEVFFKQPLLDRPSGVQAPVQSVYDALSEQFTISVADVQVNQSAIVAQTSIIFNLFNGAGSIELRPDRWRGVFRGLVSDKDTELVIRCLQTAGAAIEKTSDRISGRWRRLSGALRAR